MNEMDKYYQILGLDAGASESEVIQAYKILIKALQPDRFGKGEADQKIAEEKIKEIDEAFKALLLQQNKQVEETLEQKRSVKPEPSDKGDVVVQTEPAGATVYFNEKHKAFKHCVSVSVRNPSTGQRAWRIALLYFRKA